MIAEVTPLKRLPRRFRVFDYIIPETLDVSVGDIVLIPIRNRLYQGIVVNKKQTSSFQKLAAVKSVIAKQFFSELDVDRIAAISRDLVISPAHLFTTCFQQYTPRKPLNVHHEPKSSSVSPFAAKRIQKTIQSSTSSFTQLSLSEQVALAAVAAKQPGQTLVIAPTTRIANLVYNHTSMAAVIHGKTSPKVADAVIGMWQEGSLNCLIGTKRAALLPAKDLRRVVILQSESDDYHFLARNPRVNACLAAMLQAKQHDCPVYKTDMIPPLTEHAEEPYPAGPGTVVDLRTYHEKTDHKFISKHLLDATILALQSGKSVIFFFNRRSSATAEQQTTNQDILRSLRALFPAISVGLYDETTQDSDTRVLVVTEYYFRHAYQPFNRKIGLIANLMADFSLLGDDYTTSYKTARNILNTLSIAREQKCTYLIQTFEPALVQRIIDHPSGFLQELTEARRRYAKPPFVKEYRISGNLSKIEHLIPESISLLKQSTTYSFTQELTEPPPEFLNQLPDTSIIELDTPSYGI